MINLEVTSSRAHDIALWAVESHAGFADLSSECC